jgi:hypothetical protein
MASVGDSFIRPTQSDSLMADNLDPGFINDCPYFTQKELQLK